MEIKKILKRETKGLNINNKTRNHLIFSYDDIEGLLEEVKKETIKEVLDYLSERGFRESNYEIIELTKWLRKQ